MAKFVVFFTFKGETIRALMDKPSDRAAVAKSLVESAGGTMEAYYVMFGQYDGFVIADLPDSRAAGAVSLAVSSSGAFGHVETHEIVSAADFSAMLESAKSVQYTPPGG
ncbi:MAG: GYD domain-containing protein [Actinomycetes bacterium]